MIEQKMDLGEYVIVAKYDKATGFLEVSVLDELGDTIDGMTIENDENPED